MKVIAVINPPIVAIVGFPAISSNGIPAPAVAAAVAATCAPQM